MGDTRYFREILSRSTDHWLERLETRFGLDPAAWNGLSVGDIDNDGLDDIYVCQPGGIPNGLLRQRPDGTIEEIGEQAGVNLYDQTQSALFVDLDNDGDQDLALAISMGVLVLANDGQGHFTGVAARLIPGGIPYSLSAADYDQDGDLDLYACCYSKRRSELDHRFLGRPIPYHDANNGARNALFHNHGQWKFQDVTKAVGLSENNLRFSFAASWEDYDNDGDLDLYVANDYGRNNLYRNQGGTFVDVAAEAGVEDMSAGMSVSWGDVNNESPTAGDQSSAADYFRNWDSLGLMLARGSSFSGHERNCVFLNTGNSRFADVSAVTGLDFLDDARAVALTDWDHDGDLDILLANRNAPRVRLMRNELPAANSAVALRLVGDPSNRVAVGARVEVTLAGEDGTRRLTETCRAGTGFLTQSSKWLHFGVGATARITGVRIRWPNSTSWEAIDGITAGSRYVVRQGSGTASRQSPRSNLELAPGVPELPPASSNVRVFLTRRVSVPELEFEDFRGEVSPARKPAMSSATLINLWASWCQPCLQELGGLARHHQQLREAGLDVVALSTDEVSRGSREAAEQVITALDFPFPAGLANAELVKTLSLLRSKVFYKETPLPLPCSFLLDRQGRWACYYGGPVEVEQLLENLQLLDAPRERLDEETFPGTGRFVFRDTNVNSLAIADAYLDGGYDEEASRELTSLLERLNQQPVPEEEGRRESLRQSRVEVVRRLADIAMKSGDHDQAAELWQQAVRLEPQSPSLRLGLVSALKRQGRIRAAGLELEQILAGSPQEPDIYLTVGMSWLSLNEIGKGIDVFQQGLRLDETHRALRFALATALQKAGTTTEAIDQYELLAGSEDSWAARACNNLAWLRATHNNTELRDGQEAVKLARKACQLTGNENAKYLGTLGSAWAEAGEFARAIEVTQQALQLVRDEELTESLQKRLELYRQSQPYHTPP